MRLFQERQSKTWEPIKIFFFIIAMILLFGAGWYAHGRYNQYHDNVVGKRITISGYKFISPLLDVELPEGYSVNHEPIPFKYKIKNFVEQQIQSGNVLEVSVYYHDLLDGPWFGINEDIKYNPASMMKVPVMIGWLKRAERDPSVLQQKLTFDEKAWPSIPQTIQPQMTLKNGTSYTIEELLRYMISFSDNRALLMLVNGLTDKEYSYILDTIDINNDPSDKHNFVTVHSYSGFFRILYNASFLNKEMSEKALQLLSLPDFTYGIIAGVPKGIIVASKFGEYYDNTSEVQQLHEFGIIYHPKGPYILGVLTRGNDIAKQASLIRSVSEMVYSEVNTVRP
jgi:beta-lactamase class A